MGAGGLCVTTDGTCVMQLWPAGSWAVGGRWPPQEGPDLAQAQGLCGWMMWGAEVESRP